MSTLKFILLITSSRLVFSDITPDQQACIDSITISGFPFCRINDSISQEDVDEGLVSLEYASPEEYCTDPSVTQYDSLEYFKVAPFTQCDLSYSICYTLEHDGEDLLYTNTSVVVDGTNYDCYVTYGEFCYRTGSNESHPFENIEDISTTSTPTTSHCCLYECDKYYTLTNGGCGSDGNFYEELTPFCEQFCNNRSYTIVPCGETDGTTDCRNHPQCPSECILTAPNEPVCGYNGILYSNKQDLCTAIDGGVIEDYFSCTTGCTENDCQIYECLKYLDKINYTTENICGNTGTFYTTRTDYCKAYYNNEEFIFMLCDKQACTTEYDCCFKKCSLSYSDPLNFCTTEFEFYTDRDTLCDDICRDAGIIEYKCDDRSCTLSECQEAECNNTSDYIKCNDVNGELFTRADYCAIEIAGNSQPSTVYCTYEGSNIDCTQIECDYLKCINELGTTYSECDGVCGYSGTFYESASDYCEALIKNSTETSLITCDGSICENADACCISHCINVTFAGGFTERCRSEDLYIYYDVEEYCSDYCGDSSPEILMCPENCDTPCDETGCCYAQCERSSNYDVCDANYNLVKGIDDCKAACDSEDGGIYDCGDRDCTISDCKYFECLDMMEEYNGTSVCAVDKDGVNFYETKAEYCAAYLSGSFSVPYTCVDGCCESLEECKISLCTYISSLYGPICGTNNVWYTNNYEFCTDVFQNDIQPQACLTNDIIPSLCNEKQCCYNNCENEILYDGCNVDYWRVETAEFRCEFRCNGEVIGRPDLIVDECYDCSNLTDCTDCRPFKCEDQITPYEYEHICIKTDDDYHKYFESKQQYCEILLAEGEDEFKPIRAIECGETEYPRECENEEDCCYRVCLMRESLKYRDQCEIDTYYVLNLNLYCMNYCSSEPIPTEGCGDHDCVQSDCDVKECLATLNAQYSSICLPDDILGIYFYQDHLEYCNEVVENGKISNYDLNGRDIGCQGCDGAEACSDDDQCCFARCMIEPYETSCNDATYDLVYHEDFCHYRCNHNNPTRSDLPIDQCHDKCRQQIPCENCEIFICMDSIANYESTTICIEENYRSQFYISHYDFCSYKIENDDNDYSVNGDILCDGMSCISDYDCCFEACTGDPDFRPGCDVKTHDFNDISTYCDRKCRNEDFELYYCGRKNCTYGVCEFNKCMHESTPTFTKICISNNVDGKIYFENQEEYCHDKLNAEETDYDNLHEVYCEEDGRCNNLENCCVHSCIAAYPYNNCNLNNFELASPHEYCTAKCDPCTQNSLEYLYHECKIGPFQRNCHEKDCDMLQCEAELTPVYNGGNVCDSSDHFYGPVEIYCKLRLGEQNYQTLCNGSPCANDYNCCVANCNARTDFVPQCDIITYNYITCQAEYCNAYCNNNRSFLTYYVDGRVATQEECCLKECEHQNNGGDPVCDSITFELYTSDENCANICYSNSNIIICEKEGGCTQRDCDIAKCVKEIEDSGYIGEQVCASNSNLYENYTSYCEAYLDSDKSLHIVTWNNQGCNDEYECCFANCHEQNSYNFQPICNTGYTLFTNVNDYCSYYCNNNQVFETLTCGDHNCNSEECCEQECLNTTYTAVCTAAPDSVLVSQSDYCSNMCYDFDNYENTISRCDGCGCTEDDCTLNNCIYDISIPFENNPVCGHNSYLYDSVASYCSANITHYADYFYLCGGFEICDDFTECCSQSCPQINNEDFVPRCDNNFTWYTDPIEYCNSVCDEIDFYSGDLYCGENWCNEIECCQAECMTHTYNGFCDEQFEYVSQTDYCSAVCNNALGSVTTCEGGCTEYSCAVLQCQDDLSEYEYSEVCILDRCSDNNRNYLFFDSIESYCDAAVTNDIDAVTYTITNDVGCGDEPSSCGSADLCCKQLCLNDNLYTTCNTDDHSLVTNTSYCDYFCGNNDPISLSVNNCNDEGNQTDCSDCYIFKCRDDLEGYPFTKVCGKIDEEYTNYSDVDSFCATAISAGITEDYDSLATVCVSGGNIAECGNDDECCLAFCHMENSDFENTCKSDDYTLYTIDNLCSDYCQSLETDTLTCEGSCTADDCEIKKCESETSLASDASICLTTERGTDFYYDNSHDFCVDEINRETPSYDLSSGGLLTNCSPSECTSDVECCFAKCLANNTYDTCNSETFDVVTPAEYCNYRCDNSDLSSGIYTNLNVLGCSDGEGQINCTSDSCSYEDCITVSSTIYGENQVCGLNYELYDDVESYCQAHIEQNVGSTLCDGSQCLNESTCCNAACIAEYSEGYVGKCSEAELLFRETVEDFCTEYCANDRIFDALIIEGVLATSEECCINHCQTTDLADKTVCSLETYTTITSENICEEFCNPESAGYHECEGDCTQEDCDIEECITNNGGESAEDFCVENDTYYASARELCEAHYDNASLNLITCEGSSCSNESNCCIANCIIDNPEFTTGCTEDFTKFNNVNEYCSAFCAESVELLQCEGENCDIMGCCITECNNNESFTDVCSPPPSSILLNQSDYCNTYCDDNSFASAVITCPDGCSESYCQKVNCMFETEIVFESDGPVCGNNGNNYDTIESFCDANVSNSDLTFTLCGESQVCADDEECCFVNCMNSSEENYEPRCNTNYDWLADAESYCQSYCQLQDSYENLYCDGENLVYCDQLQCCSRECEDDVEYVPVCDQDYNLIEEDNYCEVSCAPDFTPITCDGDCDQNKCNSLKCSNENSNFEETSICLKETSLEDKYYSTLKDYCDVAITVENFDVIIASENFEDCGEETGCTSTDDCCIAACRDNNPFDKCLVEDYEIITSEDYCAAYCQDDAPETNSCKDEGNADTDCINCQYFKCLDDFDGYSFTKVCAHNESTYAHYESVELYCADASQNESENYNENITMCKNGDNEDIECETDETCCNQICLENNSEYVDTCETESFTVYNKNDLCSDVCQELNPLTESCAENYCVQSDCDIKNCTANAGNDFTSICLLASKESRFFFDNITDYCETLVGADNTNWTIDDGQEVNNSDNNYSDTYDCCIGRCLNETYYQSCLVEENRLIDQVEFCTYRCDNNNPETDNYEDMSLEICTTEGSQRDCVSEECSVKNCEYIFEDEGYSDAQICLLPSSELVGEYYYSTVSGYCQDYVTFNGDSIVSLPDYLDCNVDSCEDKTNCCIGRCLLETYYVGCDSENELVTHQSYCEQVCETPDAGLVEVTLNYCGDTDCTTCSGFACLEDLEPYSYSTICLINAIEGDYFFESKNDYCSAINAGGDEIDDYSLSADSYVLCESTGCSEIDCCEALCAEESFYNVCTSDYAVYSDSANFCTEKCDQSLTGYQTCTFEGNAVNCTEQLCCEIELYDSTLTSNICGTNGVIYATSISYCSTKLGLADPTDLDIHTCAEECSDEECYINYCSNLETNTSVTTPFCGSDNNLYSNLDDFCGAKFEDSLLEIDDATCSGPLCTQAICCEAGCEEGSPVIVLIEGSPVAVDNECVATCNEQEVIYTCEAETLSDCEEEFNNACSNYCLINAPSADNTYCGLTSGFYNNEEYCLTYMCPQSNQVGTFTVNPSCSNNDCTSESCSIAQCISDSCSGVPSDPVCGASGNVYDNSCILSCHNDSQIDVCSNFTNLNGCEAECSYLSCVETLTPDDVSVCGNDNSLYDNKCEPLRENKTVRFVCPSDCSGIVRTNRCGFDCRNGRTYTNQEFVQETVD